MSQSPTATILAALSFFVSAAGFALVQRRDRTNREMISSFGGLMKGGDYSSLHLAEERHKEQRSGTSSDNDITDGCIYLDYSGTTPVYPQVLEAMLPYLSTHFGNPSSSHAYGREPTRAVGNARGQVLSLLLGSSCDEKEDPSGVRHDDRSSQEKSIWFTACGTEADNLAIQIALQSTKHLFTQDQFGKRSLPHIVTCNVEHPAIEVYLKKLSAQGACTVTYVPVQPDGRVASADMVAAIQENKNTVLVSLMLANNESGALQPVQKVAEYCRGHDILFHSDAAQAAGKVSVQLADLGYPDMVTLVGHKLGAPKGIACLYVRPECLETERNKLPSGAVLLHGGGQEFGRRGGTENVPYIVALGKAAELARTDLTRNRKHLEALRCRMIDQFERYLGTEMILINGPILPAHRLPNTLSIGLNGVHSGHLLNAVGDKVAASAGAACHSSEAVSRVLRAMKVPPEFARGTIRLSVGPTTTEDEVDRAIEILVAEIMKQTSAEKIAVTP